MVVFVVVYEEVWVVGFDLFDGLLGLYVDDVDYVFVEVGCCYYCFVLLGLVDVGVEVWYVGQLQVGDFFVGVEIDYLVVDYCFGIVV